MARLRVFGASLLPTFVGPAKLALLWYTRPPYLEDGLAVDEWKGTGEEDEDDESVPDPLLNLLEGVATAAHIPKWMAPHRSST